MNYAMPLPATRPISDLRTDLNGICEQARLTNQPIFMTKSGAVSLVVMDCETYERQRQHERYVMKLREAEIEAQYRPESVSQEQLDKHLDDIFAEWGL